MRQPLTTAMIALALAATPALAPAEGIDISGTAEMGVAGGSQMPDGTRMRLLTDLDLQFRMSTTTDSGLTFGIELDLDDLELADPSRDRWTPHRR